MKTFVASGARYVVILVVAFALGGRLRAQNESFPTCSISGRVLGIDDQPLAARVSLQVRKKAFSARTAADGVFNLTELPVGAVAQRHGSLAVSGLMIEAEGYAPLLVAPPVVPMGGSINLGDLIVPQGTVIQGQVLSPQAVPVADAKVRVTLSVSYLGNTGCNLQETLLKTDWQGRFKTSRVPAGTVNVSVEAPGLEYVPRFQTLDGSQSLVELQPIRLRKEFPVVIEVHDEQGRPIESAKLIYNSGSGETDAAGRLVLPGMKQGYHIQVNASADGYRPAHKLHHGQARIQVVLRRAHMLLCRLADSVNGRAVTLRQAILCEYSLDAQGKPLVAGCRNTDFHEVEPGRYQVEHSGPQRYHLLLKADGYHDREVYLDGLKVDKDWDIGEIRLEPSSTPAKEMVVGQSIAGVLRREGKGVSRATVSLWAPGAPISDKVNAPVHYGRLVTPAARLVKSALSDASGNYNLDVPYQGAWLLRVDLVGEAPTLVGPFEIERGKAMRRDLALVPGGELSGSVRYADLFANGVLWAIAFDDRGQVEIAQVKSTGMFRFPRLAPGQYGVKIGHLGYKDPELISGADEFERRTPADPWARARKIIVKAGHTALVDATAPIR